MEWFSRQPHHQLITHSLYIREESHRLNSNVPFTLFLLAFAAMSHQFDLTLFNLMFFSSKGSLLHAY